MIFVDVGTFFYARDSAILVPEFFSLKFRTEKMMQVLLYPQHVSFSTFASFSPKLFTYLKEKAIPLEYKYWEGKPDSLPITPSIVRGSPMIKCDWGIFTKKCYELGHFVFYGDNVVLPDGVLSNSDLMPKLKEFLAKHGLIAT